MKKHVTTKQKIFIETTIGKVAIMEGAKLIVENEASQAASCLIVVVDYSSMGGHKTYHGPFLSSQEVKTWIKGSGIEPRSCQMLSISDPAEFIRDEGINRLVPPNEVATDSDMH